MAKATSKAPGDVLLSFIEEYGINPTRLGAAVNLSQSTVRQITLNKMKISVPVALRLAKYFGNSIEFWTNLQLNYELAMAANDKELSEVLKGIQKIKKPVPVMNASAIKAPGKEKAGVKKNVPARHPGGDRKLKT